MITVNQWVLSIIIVMMGVIFTLSETNIKPLIKVVREHNQMIADCEAKLPRAEFCELTALPKVKK